MVTVILTPDAQQQMDALPVKIHTRVRRLLVRLENWPEVSGARPLRGGLKGRWRMRTGDYRLQFRPHGETVVVEKIGHRDRFYD